LAIGVAEGIATATILCFVYNTQPKKAIAAFAALTLVAGVLSMFASSSPDGLEWSLEKAAITTVVE
jgi:cobalt/nickel transport system permease protein